MQWRWHLGRQLLGDVPRRVHVAFDATRCATRVDVLTVRQGPARYLTPGLSRDATISRGVTVGCARRPTAKPATTVGRRLTSCWIGRLRRLTGVIVLPGRL